MLVARAVKERSLLISLFIHIYENIADCKQEMATYFRCAGWDLLSMGIGGIVFEEQCLPPSFTKECKVDYSPLRFLPWEAKDLSDGSTGTLLHFYSINMWGVLWIWPLGFSARVVYPALHLLVATVQGSVPAFFYFNLSPTYFTKV